MSPISQPPIVHAAPIVPLATARDTPETCRPVEGCGRACDSFERRRPDAYDAPPGAVPFGRYLQASNTIAGIPGRSAPPHQRQPACEVSRAPGSVSDDAFEDAARPEAPRLGDVSTPRPETPEPGEIPRRVVTTRHAATGLIFDAVF